MSKDEQASAQTYIVHPAADQFPMLDQKRIEELAADIKVNGLIEPIELYDGQVLDGRNRLKACAMAGVAPRFVTVNCDNPWWHVWSRNGQRRDLPDLTRANAFLGCQAGAEAFDLARAEAEERRRGGIAEATSAQPRADNGRMMPKEPDDQNNSGHPVAVEPPAPEQKNRSRNRENTTAHAIAKKAGVSRAVSGAT